MTSTTLEEFLVQLDHHKGAKNRKIFLFIDQCAAHPGDNTALKNVIFLFFPPKLQKPFATTGYGDHPYSQMPVQKATHMDDSSND
jgi:hypothetical protein